MAKKNLQTRDPGEYFKAAVPQRRPVGLHWSVGHTGRIKTLHSFLLLVI